MSLKNNVWHIFIILLLIAGCRRQVENPYLPYETIYDDENNNTFDTALPLKVGASLNIAGFYGEQQNPFQDKDFYRLSLGNSGVAYRMTLTAVPGVDGILNVYSPNQEILFVMNEHGIGEAEVVWDYYCRYSEIFVTVEAKEGSNKNVPYMLRITADNRDSLGEIEPNNQEETATVLTPLFPLKGYIVPANDVDYYHLEFEEPVCDFRVKVESFSNLDISLTLIEVKKDTQIEEVFDTSTDSSVNQADSVLRRSCVVNQNGWGGSEITQYFSSGKGDFYACVTAQVQGTLKEPVYYITLEALSDTAYEREFNDDKENATPLLVQEEISGELEPSDVDWFYFDVLYSGSRVDLSLEGMSDRHFLVDIEKTDGTSVYNGKGTVNFSLRDVDSGRYYLILHQDGKTIAKNRYQLFLNIYTNHQDGK